MRSYEIPTPVEVAPPDLVGLEVCEGHPPFVHVLEGAAPGPSAMITGLVHGNELCGALALADLLRSGFKPKRGRLVVAFANVPAYQRFDPAKPGSSRFIDEDLNRLWDPARLDSADKTTELVRAREMRPFLDQADYLLDLHSMSGTGPAMALAGLTEKGLAFAKALGTPSIIVRDQGHTEGRRMRDYGRFSDDSQDGVALLVECGLHWQQQTSAMAAQVVQALLAWLGMTDQPPPTRKHQTIVTVEKRVTVRTANFRFQSDFQALERIEKAGTIIAQDGPSTVVTPFDNCVLILPTHGCRPGQTAVRFARETQDA